MIILQYKLINLLSLFTIFLLSCSKNSFQHLKNIKYTTYLIKDSLNCVKISSVILGLEQYVTFDSLNIVGDTLFGIAYKTKSQFKIKPTDESIKTNINVVYTNLYIFNFNKKNCTLCKVGITDSCGKFNVFINSSNVLAFSKDSIPNMNEYYSCIMIK